MNPNPDDGIIRITKDEVMDMHVDDMLKRQMSLRGQGGVTRDHGRKWYYQNWFVFMMVGTIGALIAWAIIEPILDDMIYFQGAITAIDTEAASDPLFNETNIVLKTLPVASVTINNQKIFLMKGMKELVPGENSKKFDLSTLKVGQTIGLYVHYQSDGEQELALSPYVVRNPPPQSPERAKKTLEQLDRRSDAASMVFFPLTAGLIGLLIGAVDGLICRLPRRALLCGLVGLLVGLVGGFIANLFGNLIYGPLSALAERSSGDSSGLTTLGFIIQLFGRSLAWGLIGTAMGLGQGIALRSTRLLLYGLIGGVVGGLLGGLFFDPVDMILLGHDKPSGHWSRMIGVAVIGLSVGGMIGIVELLARDAWLRMTQGPLTGKEFLIFKDIMNVGSSPRSDIYLFNDPLVGDNHAVIRARGDACEIEARQKQQPILVNERSVTHARLRHGDTVSIGRTVFVFQQRKT